MKKAEIPENEAERLRSLLSLNILDTPKEERFDRLTRLVSRLLNVPIALVSLVDSDRQWFKSSVGLEVHQTPRDVSFCAHAILEEDTFIITNAAEDPRFENNPFVTSDPHIQFYAGHPLRAPGGHRVGTLCAIDRVPHELTGENIQVLKDLAAIAESELQIATIQELEEELNQQTSLKQKSQAEIDQFFQMSLGLLCISGTDGYFKRLNPAFETTLGWTREELMSKPFVEFIHPDDLTKTLEVMAQLEQGHEIVNFENRYLCKDGSIRWILWSSRSLAETEMLYSVARDVTSQKKIEAELRAAKEEAESASRIKSEFLANMSHELRTPLNSVIGFSNILKKNKKENLSEKEISYVERIAKNGTHLLYLINQILDLSKIEAGRMEVQNHTFDLVVLCREIVALLEPQLGEQTISLHLECDAQELPLFSDRSKLKQVLTNLISNAVKFTKEGTVCIKVHTNPSSQVVRQIDVVDTGPGIAERHLRTIFEAFLQADGGTTRKHGGTGLGLTISRSLCGLLGFSLSVESEIGVGTTFSIRM